MKSGFFTMINCKSCKGKVTHLHSIGGYCPTCVLDRIKELEKQNDMLEKIILAKDKLINTCEAEISVLKALEGK